MKYLKPTHILLTILLLFLTAPRVVAADDINVQVRFANQDRFFRLVGNSVELGSMLRDLLSDLDSGTSCWVYAQSETTAMAQGIVVDASHLNLVMRNVTIKARGGAFRHVIRFEGVNTTIFGVKVEGPDDRRIVDKDNRIGIDFAGANGQIIGCEASNMPDGNSFCFFVRGNRARVSRCRATNPGYACFQNVAKSATYDQIEAVIDSPTLNTHNRLFNSHGYQPNDPGHLLITNSTFKASYADNTPIKLQEAAIRIGDVRLFEMRACKIELGDNVNNVVSGNHIIKLSSLVRNGKFVNLTIKTTNPDFRGHALSLAGGKPGRPMNCQISHCDFAHGIVALTKTKNLLIDGSSIGTLKNKKRYLLQSFGNVKNIRILNSNLANSDVMMHFGVPDPGDSKLTVRNVKFKSGAPRTSYVFSDARKNYPVRASFLDAIDFSYEKSKSSDTHPLYLAAGHTVRLAMTSASSQNANGNSLLFDGRHGVKNITSAKSMLGPPFAGMPGIDGDKIYLKKDEFNDPSAHGWRNADYWEYDAPSKTWKAHPAR